jgi:hypothetical protein
MTVAGWYFSAPSFSHFMMNFQLVAPTGQLGDVLLKTDLNK